MLHKLPTTGKKCIYPQSMWYWGKHGNAILLPVRIKKYTKLFYVLLKLRSPLWVLFLPFFFPQTLWGASDLRSFILSLARLFNIAAYTSCSAVTLMCWCQGIQFWFIRLERFHLFPFLFAVLDFSSLSFSSYSTYQLGESPSSYLLYIHWVYRLINKLIQTPVQQRLQDIGLHWAQ